MRGGTFPNTEGNDRGSGMVFDIRTGAGTAKERSGGIVYRDTKTKETCCDIQSEAVPGRLIEQ